jgi:hypothetical protein
VAFLAALAVTKGSIPAGRVEPSRFPAHVSEPWPVSGALMKASAPWKSQRPSQEFARSNHPGDGSMPHRIAVALPCFEEADYVAIRNMLVDVPSQLPESYVLWIIESERLSSTLATSGLSIRRVRVTSDELAALCDLGRIPPTRKACFLAATIGLVRAMAPSAGKAMH